MSTTHNHRYSQLSYECPRTPDKEEQKEEPELQGRLPSHRRASLYRLGLSLPRLPSPNVTWRTAPPTGCSAQLPAKTKHSQTGGRGDVKNSFPAWKALNTKLLWISLLLLPWNQISISKNSNSRDHKSQSKGKQIMLLISKIIQEKRKSDFVLESVTRTYCQPLRVRILGPTFIRYEATSASMRVRCAPSKVL